MKQFITAYLLLTLVLINALFLLQIVLRTFTDVLAIEQWILVIANFILIFLSLASVSRKNPAHFSRHEATVFQLLFSILLVVNVVMILILLLTDPVSFLIFMPFQFFLIGFYIGMYFLISRHILPFKQK